MMKLKRKKQTKKEQIELLEYMYELLESGYSMKQSLGFLETFVQQKEIYHEIVVIFESGRNFSEVLALLQYPQIIQTLVQFGEKSGMFQAALKRSVDYLKMMSGLRMKLMKKIQYPIVVLIATLLFVIGFRLFLLPQIIQIQSMIGGNDVTWTSRLVIHLLNAIPYGIVGFLGSISLCIGVLFFLYRKQDSRWFDWLLHVPYFHRALKVWNQLQLSMLMRVFLEQGYGVKGLFEEMQKEGYPCHIQRQASIIYRYLNEGYTYHQSLVACGMYSRDYLLVIQRGIANKTLNLDLMFYEQYGQKQFETMLTKVINLFLPIIYAHVGILIILAYLAFILPMLDMLGTI